MTYAAGSGPATVFVKAEAAAHREVHARNGNLFNESGLYASGMPIPVDHPLVYRVIIDRAALDYAVVMEDLMRWDADPRDSTRPLTVDQAANGTDSWQPREVSLTLAQRYANAFVELETLKALDDLGV